MATLRDGLRQKKKPCVPHQCSAQGVGANPNNRPAQRATTELSRAYFGISMMVVSGTAPRASSASSSVARSGN